jgi:anti-sigma factor RsiW
MLDETTVDCAKLAPLIDAFYDGELSEAEKGKVAYHVHDCQVCQRRLNETEMLVGALQALPRLQMARDLQTDWEALAKKKFQTRGAFPRVFTPQHNSPVYRLYWVAAASLVLLILISGLLLLNPINKPPTVAERTAVKNPSAQISQQEAMGARGPALHEGEQTNATIWPLFSSDPSLVSEDLGISTDEDGLYALKL